MEGFLTPEQIRERDAPFINLISKNNLSVSFFNKCARGIITYGCSLGFLLTAALMIVSPRIPWQTTLIFWGIAFCIYAISHLILRNNLPWFNPAVLVFWLGNVSGFLFSFIYAIAKIGITYGYPTMFGGIGTFLLDNTSRDHTTYIEASYGVVGALLFHLGMWMCIARMLVLKDHFDAQGRKFAAFCSFVGAILAAVTWIGIFVLAIAYFESIALYILYSVIGSMLFIYANNLFNKDSGFLNFKKMNSAVAKVMGGGTAGSQPGS